MTTPITSVLKPNANEPLAFAVGARAASPALLRRCCGGTQFQSRARLHMAQPPLSVAIRQLEQELGTDLSLRTTREVKLTDAGRVLLDGARRTLAEADRAVGAAKRAGTGNLAS